MYYVEGVDGTPYIKIVHTPKGYELWWKDNYRCWIYPYRFLTFHDAEKALYIEYGRDNVRKVKNENN